jgi:hypothetical protein
LDANRLYHSEADNFSANWPKMAENVIANCRKSNFKRNKSVQAMLKLLSDDPDDVERQTVALFLLPQMTPPTIVKAASGKTKSSKLEVQDEFIKYYPVSTSQKLYCCLDLLDQLLKRFCNFIYVDKQNKDDIKT